MATSHPFLRGSKYTEQHRSAKEKLPGGGPREGTFLVAVRQHVEEYAESFLWFLVKPTTTVAKVRRGYFSKCQVQVSFKLAEGPISDTTQIKDLNHFGDSIIVFTAHEETSSSASATASQTLTLLQPIHSQAHHILPVIKSEPKSDNQLLSPSWDGRHSYMTAPSQAHINNENNVSNQRSSGSNPSSPNLADQGFGRYAGGNGGVGGPSSSAHAVQPKIQSDDAPMHEAVSAADTAALQPQVTYLQNVIRQGSPERLEATVNAYQEFLDSLRTPLSEKASESPDADDFLQQVEALRTEKVDTATIIGVVGNTGAGKSSVINAMLEEERLVPTNCMRACTAVVTEMSWNSSEDSESKYRANIEFIQRSDWEKDLRVSLADVLDHNGQVSKECTNAESEAGIAYAKIKAVYPHKTKEQLASCTVKELMDEPWVKAVLGTIKNIQQASPEPFYKSLQRFVDSNEKTTGSKKRAKGEKKQPEYWPLIKVVRIYTKADALSTGAVIVDLPGVHDSNAARAAVAAGYMKQCTGLWIVAPINRAVDDKAAKNLMGSPSSASLITEASDSLGLEEEMREDWEKIDEIDVKKRALKTSLQEIRDSKAVYSEVMDDADNAIELWEKLRDDLEDGQDVFAPSHTSKKRKRGAEPKERRKRSKNLNSDDSDFIDDRAEDDETDKSDDGNDSESSQTDEDSGEHEELVALSKRQIEDKLSLLKEDKKRARKERADLDRKMKATDEEVTDLEEARDNIETAMSAICIAGRNKYSKGAIQQDFAAGIRELDQENSAEEDDENFNPEEDIRDYEEVARSLPVFCCSSRAYQKMSGRLQRDSKVPGFRSKEETEIPQLQQHCKQLTEGVRASNCRRFLTNLSQLLNSLNMWASNDGTRIQTTDSQRQTEARFLKARLQSLDKSLDQTVKGCLSEMSDCLAENIFENFPNIIEDAASKAVPKAQSWGAPVNRSGTGLPGGFHWGTYKALMRRNGVFSNANGPHDLNMDLCEPIIKHLASHWEKAFARRLPSVLASFSRKSKHLLLTFHKEVEARSLSQGAGVAGLAMLRQQLHNYEAIFVNLSTQMLEIINSLQREANRDFTPVIGSKLAEAYETCAQEQGTGMFSRMKAGMNDHVANNLDMFEESCNEVKSKLTLMCRQVEETMSNKADEVYMNMSRDYMEVISGKKIGELMPKWERLLRAEVSRMIEEREQADLEAEEADDKVELDASNADASARPNSAIAEEADGAIQKAGHAQAIEAGTDGNEMNVDTAISSGQ